MGLLAKGKIDRDKKRNGLKKKINKLSEKSETKRDGTAKESVNKLKRKSETGHGGTVKKSVKKLKRKNETVHDGAAKKPKKQRTEDEVSSDLDRKTKFINKLDGDSGDNAGDYTPSSRDEDVKSYRLFVKAKNKIISEEDVKDLHPDVISVRFPRKKRTRWCWAIFANEEKAAKALEELKQREDIIVSKPSTKSKESLVKKKKPVEAKLKKEIKNKLLATWL